MDRVRTFIALELPDAVKQALDELQHQLRAAAKRHGLAVEPTLKWVNPAGVHLTLVFLGNVEAELIPALAAATAAAGAGQRAAHLRLAGLGTFPNPRQPRVLWTGLAGDVETVRALQQRLQEHLAPLGFVPERRPFAPHITLARVREVASAAERKAVADLVAAGPVVPEARFVAEHLSLMKSTLHPAGARYEALHTLHLA